MSFKVKKQKEEINKNKNWMKLNKKRDYSYQKKKDRM